MAKKSSEKEINLIDFENSPPTSPPLSPLSLEARSLPSQTAHADTHTVSSPPPESHNTQANHPPPKVPPRPQILRHSKSDISVGKSSLSSWTEIDYPEVPKEFSHLVPDAPESKPKQLSGYLGWQESNKLRKVWKNKWFRLDEHIGKLFYYEDKANMVPLGFIDLSNASFSFDVEHPNSGRFSIVTPTNKYQLMAQNRDTMRFWLDQLQKKRRHIILRNSQKTSDSSEPHLGPMASEDPGGLVGEELDTTPPTVEGDLSEEETDEIPDSVALDKPVPFDNRRTFLNSFKKTFSTSAVPKPTTSEDSSKFYLTASQDTYPTLPVEPQARTTNETSHYSPVAKRKVTFPRSFRRPTECPKCLEMKDDVKALMAELKEKEQEVRDRDSICEILRAEIRRYDVRKQVQEKMIKNDAKLLLEDMTVKEEELSQLKRSLELMDYNKKQLETKLDRMLSLQHELEEQLTMYKETVKAKDDVVVQLTNEIYVLKHKGQVLGDPREALLPISSTDLEKEVEKLKESVEAYREINVFLSKEVSSLQDLRTADSANMLQLTDKMSELEAEVVRLKSKLIALLNERETPQLMTHLEPVTTGQEVSIMLKEAMESGTLMKSEAEDVGEKRENKALNADNYGFKPRTDSDGLSLSLQSFERFDMSSTDHFTAAQQISPEQMRVALEQDWSRFLRNHGNIESDLPKSEEMKQLVRRGIPAQYRAQLWRACIKDILKKNRHSYVADGYKALLKTHAGSTSPAHGQIELDLLRTLPNNVYFDSPEAKGIIKLRRILVAYSWYNPEVGYCQGLNRLAAIALLFLDEEWAFWCLVAIVQCMQPQDYYTKNLVGSQADQRVLQQILSQKVPRVAAHLNACNIDYSLITFNWFLTVFVDNIPPDLMIRVWDAFLYEGTKVLFRYAIAIFKYHEETLLKCHDSIKLYSFLRKMSLEAVNLHRLSTIAFNELNPFPMKKITELRLRYRPELQHEVDELEKIREAHLMKVQLRMSRNMSTHQGPEEIESPIEAPSDEDEED